MVAPVTARSFVVDPLLFTVEKGRHVDLEVIDRAIAYRESRMAHGDRLARGWDTPLARAIFGYVDEWAAEVTALKIARARILNREAD